MGTVEKIGGSEPSVLVVFEAHESEYVSVAVDLDHAETPIMIWLSPEEAGPATGFIRFSREKARKFAADILEVAGV